MLRSFQSSVDLRLVAFTRILRRRQTAPPTGERQQSQSPELCRGSGTNSLNPVRQRA
ncbi:hypothetical protein HMPREF0972_00504 [Actinomyces sp. oral taxon 848 str. F0332]|nr:hypothetical protein HMPREF0972_00504 [Actinomyces sp. oral taxon 848 str. F0332]